ncbi:MAG: GAF domain-containing protein, partial [Chloroflexota bacterium]
MSLAFLWVLTLVSARLLVRPVLTLTSEARHMALGNLDRPIKVGEGGEISVLGESLEAMRVQLKASLEEVRMRGEELEMKVSQRTEELAARNRQLAALTTVAVAANEIRDQESMLGRCLEVVLEHTKMNTATIRLIDETRSRLVLASALGNPPHPPCQKQTVALGECPCGLVATNGIPLYWELEEHQDFKPPCQLHEAQAIAILPLRSPKEIFGVISLSHSQGEPLGLEERETLTTISNQIAIAIENARLLHELGRVEA